MTHKICNLTSAICNALVVQDSLVMQLLNEADDVSADLVSRRQNELLLESLDDLCDR